MKPAAQTEWARANAALVRSYRQCRCRSALLTLISGAAWACLNPRQAHYQELKELLFRAFETRAACTFEWTMIDSMTNRARIDALSCFSRSDAR